MTTATSMTNDPFISTAMKTPLSKLLWTFGLFAFLVGAIDAYQSCPSICTCKWKNGKRHVECRNQGQITIPDHIATETQVLDLSGNNLQILPREVFARHGLLNLQKLHLAKCNIGQIDPTAFRGLTNLVELNLSGNLLTSVPTATFADIPYLRELDLSFNPLQKIEANAFEMIPQLVDLDLSNCDLKRVASKAFVHLQQLQKLDLKNNKLAGLNEKTIETVKDLHGIELSGNPWSCDCGLRPLKSWLVSHNVPTLVDPLCERPPRLAGRSFAELSVDEFACKPKIVSMPRYVEASSGQNATILCKVGSVPASRIRWFQVRNRATITPTGSTDLSNEDNNEQDDVIVTSAVLAPPDGMEILNNSVTNRGEQKFVIFEHGTFEKSSQLVLTNVKPEDSGTFRCLAENPAGFDETKFTLQVGYFVGGVASLESSEIAGIAVSLGFIAILVSVLILLFLVRRKLCRRPGQGQTVTSLRHQQHPPTTASNGTTAKSNGTMHMNGNGINESSLGNGSVHYQHNSQPIFPPGSKTSGHLSPDGSTIVINGTTYAMPGSKINEGNTSDDDNKSTTSGGFSSTVRAPATVIAKNEHQLRSNDRFSSAEEEVIEIKPKPPVSSSPIMNHRDLLQKSGLPAFFSPQLSSFHNRYGNNTQTLPSHRLMHQHQWRGSGPISPLPTDQYPSDFGLPASPLHRPNVAVNPLGSGSDDQYQTARLSNFSPLTLSRARGSPIAGHDPGVVSAARLPTYRETLAHNPSVMLNKELLNNRAGTMTMLPSSRNMSTSKWVSEQQRAISPVTVHSPASTSGSPSDPGRSSSSSAKIRSVLMTSPALKMAAAVNNNCRESPDEGIQDDCSTDV